jgi:uncharacterized damage-inducible protein DinB
MSVEKDFVFTLFEYSAWARTRIFLAAQNLKHEQFIAPAACSHGSLRGTLVHTMSSERLWRLRCEGQMPPPIMLKEETFPILEELRASWSKEEEARLSFLRSLNTDALSHKIRYLRTNGEAREDTLLHILIHVVLHGMQHMAEAAAILTELDQSPGEIDFIHFIREDPNDLRIHS